jgi:hypothetical protein
MEELLDGIERQLPPSAPARTRLALNAFRVRLLSILPSPSTIRNPTEEERRENPGVGATIEGMPLRRLSHDELIAIYERRRSSFDPLEIGNARPWPGVRDYANRLR